MPPPRLPLFCAVLASVPVSAPEPAYPVPHPPLSISLIALACQPLRPNPTAYPAHAALRLPSLSPWSFTCAEPPRPTASPGSLLPGQSRLLAPAPGPNRLYSTIAIANNYPSWWPLIHSRPPEHRQTQALRQASERVTQELMSSVELGPPTAMCAHEPADCILVLSSQPLVIII